jgi:hypothetical protein
MRATTDVATRKALEQTRATLGACLAMSGVTPKGRAARSVAGAHVDPAAVLSYLQAHPGSRSEDIAAGLGTDTAGVRPALVGLKTSGRVVVEGKARATRYRVAATG